MTDSLETPEPPETPSGSRTRRTTVVAAFLAALLATVLLVGYLRARPAAGICRNLETVVGDWKYIRGAVEQFALENCCALPGDTSSKGDERPTFVAEDVKYHIPQLPSDPFASGQGYGYLMWSYKYCEPGIYLLHSPGPDRDEDISLARLHAILKETFELREGDYPAAFTKRSEALAGAVISRFLYDPTNGTSSDGDLIILEVILGLGDDLGWEVVATDPWPDSPTEDEDADIGEDDRISTPTRIASDAESESATDLVSPGWIDAVLARHPPDVRLPHPRWTGFGEGSGRISHAEYQRYSEYLGSALEAPSERMTLVENSLASFRDFLANPRPLSVEEALALEEARAVNPDWWTRVESPMVVPRGNDMSGTPLERVARLESARGKSLLLLAADELARGDREAALRWVERVEGTQFFLESFEARGAGYYFDGKLADVDPLAYEEVVRIQSELRRMCASMRQALGGADGPAAVEAAPDSPNL